MEALIEEMLSTIENELNNQHSWTFDGREVLSARIVSGPFSSKALKIVFDDETEMLLKPDVLHEGSHG